MIRAAGSPPVDQVSGPVRPRGDQPAQDGIRVEVRNPGHRIRARRGYVATP